MVSSSLIIEVNKLEGRQTNLNVVPHEGNSISLFWMQVLGVSIGEVVELDGFESTPIHLGKNLPPPLTMDVKVTCNIQNASDAMLLGLAKSCLINHFTSLWRNDEHRSFDYILNVIPNYLHTRSSAQRVALTNPVSKVEIHNSHILT